MFDVNKEYKFSEGGDWVPARFVFKLERRLQTDNFVFVVRFEEGEEIRCVYEDGRYYEDDDTLSIREKRQRIWIGPLGQICGKKVTGWDCYEKVDT